jgi:hypothetical protein
MELVDQRSDANWLQSEYAASESFRTETIRRAGVPKDIERLWLGHAKETITDFYAGGLVND